MSKTKRGISPVIATVLLISIALVIGAIIFLWASFFIKEDIQKFGEPILRSCERVNLAASLDGEILSIVNNGDVPVYKITFNKGDAQNLDIETYGAINLGSGQSTTISGAPSDLISITPILKGTKEGSETEYTCDKLQIDVLA